MRSNGESADRLQDPGRTGGSSTLLMAGVALGAFLQSIDGNIVNTALPVIAERMDASLSAVSWVAMSYLLSLTGLSLAAGRLVDLREPRSLQTWAFALFGVTSLACGICTNLAGLVAARFLQGVAASVLSVLGVAVINLAIPSNKRGWAFGIFGMSFSLGAFLGPGVGGVITTQWGWPWIFFVNIPLCLVGMGLSRRIPRFRPEGLPLRGEFDLPGVFLSFVTLTALTFALSMGSEIGWGRWPIVAIAAVGLFGAITFVWRERRAPMPMVSPRLFSSRAFTLANLNGSLIYLLFFGTLFLFPFYLITMRGLSAQAAGPILMSGAMMSILVSPLAGYLQRFLTPRALCILSNAGTVVSMLLFTGLTTGTSLVLVCLLLPLNSLFMGVFVPAGTTLTMSYAPDGMDGMASAVQNTGRNLGRLWGIVIFETIFSSLCPSLQKLTPERMAVAVAAFRTVFAAAAVIALAALVLLLFRGRSDRGMAA